MARLGAFYELTNQRGLLDALKEISPTLRKELGRANQATASAIQRRAQANAPRDRGDLANHIAAQSTGRDGVAWSVGVLDVTLPSRGGKNSAHLNPWVYGVWYEYGFKTRNIARRPFMLPAVQAEEHAHDERVRQAGKRVEQVMAKAA